MAESSATQSRLPSVKEEALCSAGETRPSKLRVREQCVMADAHRCEVVKADEKRNEDKEDSAEGVAKSTKTIVNRHVKKKRAKLERAAQHAAEFQVKPHDGLAHFA